METDFVTADLYLESLFSLPTRDYTQYSPLTLAYIGDAVYDLVIRTVLVKQANTQAVKLHRRAVGLVSARSQARVADALQEVLTKEEAGVYRRGRNAKPDHGAKNATTEEYLKATGLEALVGYLYLQKRYQRLLDLLRQGVGSL